MTDAPEELVEAIVAAALPYSYRERNEAAGAVLAVPAIADALALRDELAAACDAVGIPFGLEGLLRHHRGQAGAIAGFEMAELEALRERRDEAIPILARDAKVAEIVAKPMGLVLGRAIDYGRIAALYPEAGK